MKLKREELSMIYVGQPLKEGFAKTRRERWSVVDESGVTVPQKLGHTTQDYKDVVIDPSAKVQPAVCTCGQVQFFYQTETNKTCANAVLPQPASYFSQLLGCGQ